MHWLSFPGHIQAGGLAFFDRKGQICRLWLEGEREREFKTVRIDARGRKKKKKNQCLSLECLSSAAEAFVGNATAGDRVGSVASSSLGNVANAGGKKKFEK